MVLRLKTWESRSPPGLLSAETLTQRYRSRCSLLERKQSALKQAKADSAKNKHGKPSSQSQTSFKHRKRPNRQSRIVKDSRQALIQAKADSANKNPSAGWSSLVARQAHNLKVVGSNPTPATKSNPRNINALAPHARGFCLWGATTSPCRRNPRNSAHSKLLPGIPCNIHATRKIMMFSNCSHGRQCEIHMPSMTIRHSRKVSTHPFQRSGRPVSTLQLW